MSSPRFVVTELEGYAEATAARGLSVQVLDRAYCHRVVKTWRSEDYRRASNQTPFQQVRHRARVTCEALNAGQPMPTYFGRKRVTPTCGSCGGKCAKGSKLCMTCYRRSVESPHGTTPRYTNHGCRCPKCKRAWRDYMRSYMYRTGRNLTGFRPACPKCSLLQEPEARYCGSCGARLYPASFYPERRR